MAAQEPEGDLESDEDGSVQQSDSGGTGPEEEGPLLNPQETPMALPGIDIVNLNLGDDNVRSILPLIFIAVPADLDFVLGDDRLCVHRRRL